MGDRFSNLQKALALLEVDPQIKIVSSSGIYETEPMYMKDQPDFLNCVSEIETDYVPDDLLGVCLGIETKLGRIRTGHKNKPRMIDIDILFFNRMIVNKNNLTVPHLHYHERKFVLNPICEIAPEFVCPMTQLNMKEVLEKCNDFSVVSQYSEVLTA